MACRGFCAQGRAGCPHPVQCERNAGRVEQALTDWGLLAADGYSEPDDIGLSGMSLAEKVVLVLIVLACLAGVSSVLMAVFA